MYTDEKRKYSVHKAGAKARQIDFLLTFDEWWDWWQSTGKWTKRGNRKGQYCMARYGDTGPYAIGNIKCILTADNSREAKCGKPLSAEHKKKCSESLKGKPGTKGTTGMKFPNRTVSKV